MGQRARPLIHVVAVPFPAQGHISPMVELCKQIASHTAGRARISFLNSDLNHLRVLRSRKLNSRSSRMHMSDDPQEEEDTSSAENTVRLFEELEIWLMGVGDSSSKEDEEGRRAAGQGGTAGDLSPIYEAIGPRMRAAVQRTVEGLHEGAAPPVTCLLSDVRLEYTQDIAASLGIPRVALWTQSAASFTCNLAVANGFPLPPDDSSMVTSIPGVPPHRRSEMSVLLTAPPSSFIFGFSAGSFRRMDEAAFVLLNTFDELEHATVETILSWEHAARPPRVLAIGPLLPQPFFNSCAELQRSRGGGEGEDQCLAWLDTQSPASVLYVCFGTVVTRTAQQLGELARGLEASGVAFLCVLRPTVLRDEEADGAPPPPAHGGGRGLFVEWAAQLHVLSHPSVGGFLTHCGWNSVLESISAGVPMLAWPALADQGLNARSVVEQWEIGLRLDTCSVVGAALSDAIVTQEELQAKARQLIRGCEGERTRANIQKLREGARQALGSDGLSRSNLKLFVDWLSAS